MRSRAGHQSTFPASIPPIAERLDGHSAGDRAHARFLKGRRAPIYIPQEPHPEGVAEVGFESKTAASQTRRSHGDRWGYQVLADRLRDLGGEIKRIQKAIANYRPVKLDVALGDIREHVTKAVLGLKESLTRGGDTTGVARAKEALAKHVGKLVLTPITRDDRPVYKVTGSVTLPASEKCRMQVVARDGIEPPTPAFSGLSDYVPRRF